jgi:hypothetical protein
MNVCNNKTVHVTVHASDSDQTYRLKIMISEYDQFGVLMDAVEQKIRQEDSNTVIQSIEFYDNIMSKFREYDRNSKISTDLFHISAYVLRISVGKSVSEKEKLFIKGRAFDISNGIQISDKNIFIHDQLNRSEGTGLNTWDGSVVLAKYLDFNKNIVEHKKIIELGAGTGLSGIAAHVIGAQLTLLTDMKYVLTNLNDNIDINIRHEMNRENNFIVARELDWTDSTTYLQPSDVYAASNNINIYGGWDVIIGADIVWLEELVPPLVQTINALSNSETLLYLSHQVNVFKNLWKNTYGNLFMFSNEVLE